MMPILLALFLAAPSQPDFQCGPEDAACWRRMVLWEYNQRAAEESTLADAQKALQSRTKDDAACQAQKNSRFGWGVAAGLALAIGGYLIFHH